MPATVYAFGENVLGSLGVGSAGKKAVPTPVLGLPEAVSFDVACSGTHALFVPAGIAAPPLYACGSNAYGQHCSGSSDADAHYTPEIVLPEGYETTGGMFSGPINGVQAGDENSIIKLGGETWFCGRNFNGEFGFGDTAPYTALTKAPSAFASLSTAKGSGRTIFFHADDWSVAAGLNSNGQLGLGSGSGSTSTSFANVGTTLFAPVGGLSAVYPGGGHTFFVGVGGTIWAAGTNNDGQLGLGSTSAPQYGCVVVPAFPSPVVKMGAGYDFSVALLEDGSLWASGANWGGQLGLGDTTRRTSFTRVGTDNDWDDVSVGYYHVLAKKADGTLWSWGYNFDGSLGNGTLGDGTDVTSPAQILLPDEGLFVDRVIAYAGNSFVVASMPSVPAPPFWCNFLGQREE